MTASANNLMLAIKILLISVGAVSSAMVIISFVPLILYKLPTIWTGIVASWLKPPYLYVIINAIIILIAATSRSHRKEHSYDDHSQPLISARTPPRPPSEFVAIPQPNVDVVAFQSEPVVCEPVIEPEMVEVNKSVVAVQPVNEDEDEIEILNSVVTPLPEVETELLLRLAIEKPIVSSRFGHRKPATRTTAEGVKSLRVARTKRQETLESTWKKITEGRHVPLTRHMKTDTSQNHGRHMTTEESGIKTVPPLPRHHHHHQRHVIMSELSPGQDELNRRVEAFIKKFNEEMRLQRQESLQQYMEMINRGV